MGFYWMFRASLVQLHYSSRSGLMSFLSVCQLFSIRVTGPLPSTWASEMAINNDIMSNLFSKICWRKFVPSKNETISISIFHCSISTNITFYYFIFGCIWLIFFKGGPYSFNYYYSALCFPNLFFVELNFLSFKYIIQISSSLK